LYAAKPDKDKISPVISELRVESITQNSVVVMWTTDEPADSDITYGIAPKSNLRGPWDRTLVVFHAIALSELEAGTVYAFCVESRDEANNKSEECATFTTVFVPPPDIFQCNDGIDNDGDGKIDMVDPGCSNLSDNDELDTIPPPPPPGPSSSGGGSGGARPTLASISGFAYPNASISVILRPVFFGETLEKETTAATDGSFSVAFEKFPQGLYTFSVSGKDVRGVSSARKGFVFDFSAGDAPLFKEEINMPPTLSIARDVIAWGDDVLASGTTVPGTGVLVEIAGTSYEVTSDDTGHYEILINSARFTPGKISLRVRSSLISGFGHDYSPSQTIVLSVTSVPKADLNADGRIDIVDFSRFLTKPIDMNGDSVINSTDVSIFLRAFSPFKF
jgi:hypothetical protein